ncbi:orcokinin peptides-like isoform X2 [Nymphalis io]|uniref:orcokinin peptides-like isoform X2 n=1 Tax=Inachis io TaxID=171585 RepID=UPI0021670512|nr:orcokinin peptides-like isoform X2 [Nymphalis io]
MLRVAGAVALAVATLLACCSADLHQDQDMSVGEHRSGDYDTNGHKPRNLEPVSGGHLVREVRELRQFPYFMGRRFEYGSPYGGKRDPWPLASPIEYGYYGEGLPKRNFDEIDRSNLDNFVKKRNFDEIDQTSMPFPFKRFYHLYGPNNLDTPVSNFDKKRYRPDYPMDEIDLSQFPIGSKRAYDFPAAHPLR